MNIRKLKIKNLYSEYLDTEIFGNQNSNKIIIMVHEFGTDKHEGFNLFDDICDKIKDDFLIIRYDCSGFGNSQGETNDFTIDKGSEDFKIIIDYVNSNYSKFDKYVIAHSMGLYFTTINPLINIKKFIFTGLPNMNPIILKKSLINRIINSGGVYNETGISTYVRSSGKIQQFSSNFFDSFDNINPIDNLKILFNDKSKEVHLFKPDKDEIVIEDNINLIEKEIAYCNKTKNSLSIISGNHNFTSKNNRDELIRLIKIKLLD